MTQELSRLQCLRNYKGSRVEFLKAEKDDYIENLQMLVYLDGFKNPVFATKLNVFEFYTSTYYQMNRKWANIPFIFDPVKVEVKKIKLKDSEDKRFKKFLSRLTLRTSTMVLEEVRKSLYKLDSSMFSEKDKKPKREGVKLVSI